MPDTDIGPGDLAVNKTIKSLLWWSLRSSRECKHVHKKKKESKGDRSVQRFIGTIVTLRRCWVCAIHSQIQNKRKRMVGGKNSRVE